MEYQFTVAPVEILPAVKVAVVPEQILTFVVVGALGPVTVTVLVLVSVQLFVAAKPLFHVYVIICVPGPASEGLKNPIPLSFV